MSLTKNDKSDSLTRGLLESRYTEDWEHIVKILTDFRQNSIRRFLLRYTFQAATHTIWRERNRRRHGEKELPYTHLIKTIDKNVGNSLYNIRRQGDHKMDEGLITWFCARSWILNSRIFYFFLHFTNKVTSNVKTFWINKILHLFKKMTNPQKRVFHQNHKVYFFCQNRKNTFSNQNRKNASR